MVCYCFLFKPSCALHHATLPILASRRSPPALPPITPAGDPPPPPPSPPSPSIPAPEAAFVRLVSITRATLSTFFAPSVAPSPPPLGYIQARRRALQSTASELGVTTDNVTNAEINEAVAALGSDYETWAACTDELTTRGAPLPCRTGASPTRCIDGARRCGTAEENTFEPFVELDFHDFAQPFGGRSYLFEVEFKIPANEEYGKLLFHPPDTYSGDVQANRGWTLTVYDEYHHPLATPCQDWNFGSTATEHAEGLTKVQHACLPASAPDSDYDELARARFVRVTLIGEYRQLWLDSVNVYFRAIVLPVTLPTGDVAYRLTTAPSPPPPQISPSPSPPHPTDPPSLPPARAFTWYALLAPPQWVKKVVTKEPCSITNTTCAALADTDAQADGFVLSPSGCCYPIAGTINVASAAAYGFGEAGFGVF